MSNPWSAKAKEKTAKSNPWAKAAARNGSPKPTGLAALMQQKRAKKLKPLPKAGPRDFRLGGVLIHNAVHEGDLTVGLKDGVTRPWGSVDVSNGDKTFTLHNKFGSWMHDVEGADGMMAEPARVARVLGVNIGQADLARALRKRFEDELKHLGVASVEVQRKRLEQEAAEARKRKPKEAAPPPATTTKKATGKLSILTDKKVNPWSMRGKT